MQNLTLYYQILIIISVVLIYKNFKNARSFKKQNIKNLFIVNRDNKGVRIFGCIIFAAVIFSAGITLKDAIQNIGMTEQVITELIAVVLLFIGVYIPILKKTRLTDKGIIKNGSLIKWQDLKFVEYSGPIKNKMVAKVNYNSKYNKPLVLNISLNNDEEEITNFKQIVKDSRKNSKKRDKNAR